MSLAPDALGMLRVRLVALRDDLRGRIAAAETIEPAWLAMLADLETVIPALDRDSEDDPSVGDINSTTSAAERRRGGDPHAGQRRELHDGLRRMASLLGFGDGKPAAEVAREITDRCNRYQPMPAEIDPVRREMLRVRNAGVPVPTSERHLDAVMGLRQNPRRGDCPPE